MPGEPSDRPSAGECEWHDEWTREQERAQERAMVQMWLVVICTGGVAVLIAVVMLLLRWALAR
mgnify:CR=1 FL=1